jgi:hypothetical protein
MAYISDLEKVYRQLFNNIAFEMKSFISSTSTHCLFHEHEGLKIYFSERADYITADLGKAKFNFSIGRNRIKLTTEGSREYDDKVELLVIDAFISGLNFISKANNSAKYEVDNKIEELFKNFLNRRELVTPENSTELKLKVYI